MKTLRIGNREVVVEYAFEAAECKDFTTTLVNVLFDVAKKKTLDEVITDIVNTPETLSTMFYGGLLEHHGEYGDKTIMRKEDVRPLLKQYLSEETDGKHNTYLSLMTLLLGEVAADKFIELIGLSEMIVPASAKKNNAKIKSSVM